jgi:hypothetical protein
MGQKLKQIRYRPQSMHEADLWENKDVSFAVYLDAPLSLAPSSLSRFALA